MMRNEKDDRQFNDVVGVDWQIEDVRSDGSQSRRSGERSTSGMARMTAIKTTKPSSAVSRYVCIIALDTGSHTSLTPSAMCLAAFRS